MSVSVIARKVCIIGSGNFASAVARNIGKNTSALPDLFAKEVSMWVFEEKIDGRNLTDIINTEHENVKYLPGFKLPENVKAIPDIVEAANNADLFVFCLPHQFIKRTCNPLQGKIKNGAQGISLVKGFATDDVGQMKLISHSIQDQLGLPVSVMMGANIAKEIAEGSFCESTVGTFDMETGLLFERLFQTDDFRVQVVVDRDTVEMCGALKNIVAVGAGFVDGMKLGNNTKAAVIRLGLIEMIEYAKVINPGSNRDTFFESCGIADLITTCYGGRNRWIAEEFVKGDKTIEQLETELLNGQKVQGPLTALEVYDELHRRKMEDNFPLFVTVHKICIGEVSPDEFINRIRHHFSLQNPAEFDGLM